MRKSKRIISFIMSAVMAGSFYGCSKSVDTYDEESTKESVTTTLNKNEETTKEKEKCLIVYEEKTTLESEKEFYDKDENIYTKQDVTLTEEPSLDSKVVKKVDKYTKLDLIKTNDSWDYVSLDGVKGYVKSKFTDVLGNDYVEVDLSKQLLYLFVANELVDTIDITSGKKDKWDTREGCNPIYSKERNRHLKGDGYDCKVDYWIPFDGGIGLHDASWRDDRSFGGDTYIDNGSHGCVSMRDEDAKMVYDNTHVGEKVLVHH